MTEIAESTFLDYASDLLNQEYFETNIGGRSVTVSVPGLTTIYEPEEIAVNAQRIAIVTQFASTSATLSGLASNSPIGTEVNIVVELGDFGQISGNMRSVSRPGFGSNSWVVKVYISDTEYGYFTVDGRSARFTLQHLVNHELGHAFTENHPDDPKFLDIINAINFETDGGPPRDLDYTLLPFDWDQCFLAGTPISMWDGTKKPIEQVEPGDWVVSYDKDGNLKPGRVKRTMTNRAKQILDVHGLMVTPGHVTLCGDGQFNGRHVPMIDILRSDGALVLENGAKIRAATGCGLGTEGDRMITEIVGAQLPDGRTKITEVGQIRAGTRFILQDGEDVSVLEMILGGGGVLTASGMITIGKGGVEMPYRWTFTPSLPTPEGYVLQRSATHLHDIYQANEWDGVRPSMPVPVSGEAGPTVSHHEFAVRTASANVPLSMRSHADAPKMSRKYRRIAEAKARKVH
jgi:hypothetical protein